MRRRTFHRTLLALFTGAGVFAVAPSRAAFRMRRDAAREVFFYLPDRRAVLALGRGCLAAGMSPVERAFDRAARQAITADFAAGRVIRVDGWLISESEARLAATLAAGS